MESPLPCYRPLARVQPCLQPREQLSEQMPLHVPLQVEHVALCATPLYTGIGCALTACFIKSISSLLTLNISISPIAMCFVNIIIARFYISVNTIEIKNNRFLK